MILAPSSVVIPLDEVDDAVFSEKILGDGVAVEPDKGEIYSPVKGTVSVVFPTKHVVGITSPSTGAYTSFDFIFSIFTFST